VRDYLHNDFDHQYRVLFVELFFSSYEFSDENYSTFTRTFGNPVIPKTNSISAFTRRHEARQTAIPVTRVCVRLAFLNHRNRQNNVFAALRICRSPFSVAEDTGSRKLWIVHDRVPLRALANALLSSHNSTNLDTIQQQSISWRLSDRRPVFPNMPRRPSNSSSAFTTMIRNMQTQFDSEPRSAAADRPAGTFSVNYQHSGAHLIISLIRTCQLHGQTDRQSVRPNHPFKTQPYSPARIRI